MVISLRDVIVLAFIIEFVPPFTVCVVQCVLLDSIVI